MNKKENNGKSSGLVGKTLGLAAVAILILVVSISLGRDSSSKVIYEGEGLTIKAIEDAPEVQGDPSSSTAIYTEEEVFTLFPIQGFRGEVKDVQNIVMEDNFGKTYRAYMVVVVTTPYHKELTAGDELKILLPGPVEDGKIMGADFNITRAFKVGEEGVFLPVVNEDLSLALHEFTKFSLYDTTRFAFIKTDEGLDFNRDTFSALKDVTTLDQVEEYVKSRINP